MVYENEKDTKRRTTSLQISGLTTERSTRNGTHFPWKVLYAEAKIIGYENFVSRYRKQIRRYLYSSDLDHDALKRTLLLLRTEYITD